MPRITHLKTIDGQLWAKLEMDQATAEGPVHIFTEKEIRELKNAERKAVWQEIQDSIHRYDD